jgi:hypothetical protein
MTEYDISTELERDPWESPLEATPEDVFGRLSNDFAVTASNVAKYDSLHGIIVFKEPNPLVFNRYSVRGYVELAARWFREAHRVNPDSVYPFFLWNCLWRAGSSIVHGHAQVQIAKGRHYAKVEGMRRAALAYRHAYGASYFEDLSAVHGTIGLRYRAGPVDVLVNLTPTKEKEILLIAPAFDEALADAVVDVLSVFRDRLGVRSFNVGVQLPALGAVEESWQGFPVLARIVDRGDLLTRTSDFGGMELFAEAVVASDPFVVMDALIGAGR